MSRRTPVLCDLKPSGRFVATDLHRAGGIPLVMKMLLNHGLIHGDALTISGSLTRSVNAAAWTDAARTASTLTTDLKAQQPPVADPEALLDPLCSKWVDAMVAVATSVQQLSLEEMKGKRRDKHIVFPRQVAMYLIREETASSLPAIGQEQSLP